MSKYYIFGSYMVEAERIDAKEPRSTYYPYGTNSTEFIYVRKANGEIVRGSHGDWLLTGAMGNQWVLTDQVFNKFYRELQEQDEDIKVGSG